MCTAFDSRRNDDDMVWGWPDVVVGFLAIWPIHDPVVHVRGLGLHLRWHGCSSLQGLLVKDVVGIHADCTCLEIALLLDNGYGFATSFKKTNKELHCTHN